MDGQGVQARGRRSGLSTTGGGSRHLTKLEAMIDGRVILFRDLSRVKWRQAGRGDMEENVTGGGRSKDGGRGRGESNVSNPSSGDEGEGGDVGPSVLPSYPPDTAPPPATRLDSIDTPSEAFTAASTLIMGTNLDTMSTEDYRTFHMSVEHTANTWPGPPSSEIILVTSEDELSLAQVIPSTGSSCTVPQPSLDHMKAWLQALRSAAMFVSIPTPTSTQRAAAAGSRASSSAAAVHYGFFSMNSGLVFSCAGDVAVLLKSFDSYCKTIPALRLLSSLLTDIFKLIPDVQCNREGASNFGERLEDVVRVLGDGKSGVLCHIPLAESSEVNDRISDLCVELRVAHAFLRSLASPGWIKVAMRPPRRSVTMALRRGMTGKAMSRSDSREQLEALDGEITAISNKLVRQYGDSSWVLKRKVYDMVVDVGYCVKSLGGVEVIHSDQAKVRALARLIQADGAEVQKELAAVLDEAEGRRKSVEGCCRGLLLRAVCCGCFSGKKERYKFSRSPQQKGRPPSSGNLDLSLLRNEHGSGGTNMSQVTADNRPGGRAVERDRPLMSVDSDFGEHISTRFAATSSYYDDDSASNASSAGEYAPPTPQPAAASHHHRIITPERTQQSSSRQPPSSAANKSPPPASDL